MNFGCVSSRTLPHEDCAIRVPYHAAAIGNQEKLLSHYHDFFDSKHSTGLFFAPLSVFSRPPVFYRVNAVRHLC
jgi:hypothetical protein